ncbi:MAG: hypothetical protein WCJ19_03820 [bacterium]
MKLIFTNYYTTFKLCILSFFIATLFVVVLPSNTNAQELSYNIYSIPMDSATLKKDGSDYVFKNIIYRHRIDTNTYNLFYNSSIQKPILNLPVPKVIRSQMEIGLCTNPNKIGCNAPYDDYYPDAVYTHTPTKDKSFYNNLGKYIKNCNNDEASVFFYVSISDLISYNRTLSSTNSLIKSSKVTTNGQEQTLYYFDNQTLKNNDYIPFEYCYSSKIKGDLSDLNNITIGGVGSIIEDEKKNTFGRKLLGNSNLQSKFQIFPPSLQYSSLIKAYPDYIAGKINLTDSSFTTENRAIINNIGYRIGEFLVITAPTSYGCELQNNPFMLTDIYGNRIQGVNTALGCLPGSFEGIFAVVLRISIGVSSAILMILILINSISLTQSNNNPEAIKKIVNNITKAIIAILLIIFSVFILNFFSIKVLPLGEYGSVGLERIVGN